jgi:hypothetical protein
MSNVKKTRWSLEASVAISPLALFLSGDLFEGGFHNEQMFALCHALGDARPAELFAAERRWWLSLLDLAKSGEAFDNLGPWLKSRGVDNWRGETRFFTGSIERLDHAAAAIVNLWQISTRKDLALGQVPLLATDLSDLSRAGMAPSCG